MKHCAVVFLVLLVGCRSDADPLAPDNSGERPTEAPDVVLLTVSGRTFSINLFCPPECNVAYLGDPSAAGEMLQTEIENMGLTVQRDDYIAALTNYDDNNDNIADRFGFLQLVTDLEWIRDNWITGFTNPTRIVIYAHSHGCVWAHIAASVVPDCPIEVLASIDGVCLQWEGDHEESIEDYFTANPNPWSWNIAAPCDAWIVLGESSAFDVEDVAFAHIKHNLEVQSTGISFLVDLIADDQDNRREDGSETGIQRLPPSSEDHTTVDEPDSAAFAWVIDRLGEILTPTPS